LFVSHIIYEDNATCNYATVILTTRNNRNISIQRWCQSGVRGPWPLILRMISPSTLFPFYKSKSFKYAWMNQLEMFLLCSWYLLTL